MRFASTLPAEPPVVTFSRAYLSSVTLAVNLVRVMPLVVRTSVQVELSGLVWIFTTGEPVMPVNRISAMAVSLYNRTGQPDYVRAAFPMGVERLEKYGFSMGIARTKASTASAEPKARTAPKPAKAEAKK